MTSTPLNPRTISFELHSKLEFVNLKKIPLSRNYCFESVDFVLAMLVVSSLYYFSFFEKKQLNISPFFLLVDFFKAQISSLQAL